MFEDPDIKVSPAEPWKRLRRVSPKLHLMPQNSILQKDPPK